MEDAVNAGDGDAEEEVEEVEEVNAPGGEDCEKGKDCG